MNLCTLDKGLFNLQILCRQKLVNMKLANDNITLTLTYSMSVLNVT